MQMLLSQCLVLTKSQFEADSLIPVPPLPIQHQIVSHLDKLNEIIDKQRELLKVLDKLEQSIFYEMFGDPVKNEKGWEIKTLEEVCTKITDGEHLRPEVTDEGIPFLSAKDITKGYVDFSDTLFVSSETAKKSRLRCNPEYNDILIISRGATIGRSCKNDSHKVFCLLGSVILLKPDINIESDFILHFLKDKDVVQYLYSLCGAAAQQAIYLKSLKVLSIPLPPLSLQQSFASRITYIEQQKQAIQSSIDKFQEMLDGAMDEYFGDD
jgi:type I restriction enzyme S subunit